MHHTYTSSDYNPSSEDSPAASRGILYNVLAVQKPKPPANLPSPCAPSLAQLRCPKSTQPELGYEACTRGLKTGNTSYDPPFLLTTKFFVRLRDARFRGTASHNPSHVTRSQNFRHTLSTPRRSRPRRITTCVGLSPSHLENSRSVCGQMAGVVPHYSVLTSARRCRVFHT